MNKDLETRLLNEGAPSLSAKELISYVLSLTNTKDAITDLLFQRYKTLRTLCTRDPDELRLIKGLTPKTIGLLKALHALACFLPRETLIEKPLVTETQTLVEYSRLRLAPTLEQCLVYYMDREHRLIRDEIHQVGTSDHLTIYPREIIRSALNVNAEGLILVHNHPNGNKYPSSADLIMTRKIKDMCSVFGMRVLDHIIVVEDGYFSFLEEKAL